MQTQDATLGTPPFYLDDLHLGDSFTSGEHAMDEAQITAFATQFDPQPFHLDHQAAKSSMFGGLALANAGLGAVHGFAGPIGGIFPAPHGAVCAALLPHVVEVNVRALRQRQPAGQALVRYEEIARLLTGEAGVTIEDGIEWLRQLVADLKIPRLAAYGLASAHTADIVEKAAQASSMKANPIALTPEDLAEILELAL